LLGSLSDKINIDYYSIRSVDLDLLFHGIRIFNEKMNTGKTASVMQKTTRRFF